MAEETLKWIEVLEKIKSGKEVIPVVYKSEVELPLIAKSLDLFELFQLLEAITVGYNNLIKTNKQLQKKNDQLRRIAESKFQKKGVNNV